MWIKVNISVTYAGWISQCKEIMVLESLSVFSYNFTSTPADSWFVFPSTVQQPDPNQPKAEGAQMVAVQGEKLGVVTNWPPSLEAALQRWGTISPKAPCLTTMDTNGKPLHVLTYGQYMFS